MPVPATSDACFRIMCTPNDGCRASPAILWHELLVDPARYVDRFFASKASRAYLIVFNDRDLQIEPWLFNYVGVWQNDGAEVESGSVLRCAVPCRSGCSCTVSCRCLPSN